MYFYYIDNWKTRIKGHIEERTIKVLPAQTSHQLPTNSFKNGRIGP